MTLCPVCNSTLQRKADDAAKLVILRCPCCKRITAEGLDRWLEPGPGMRDQLIGMKKQADDDKAREQLFMEAPADGKLWSTVN